MRRAIVLRAVGLLAVTTLLETAMAQEPAPQILYVPFGADGIAVQPHKMDAGGRLSRFGSAGGSGSPTAAGPFDTDIHPSGRFLYANGSDSFDVKVIAIDPATGVLSRGPSDRLEYHDGGALVAEPSGRFVYHILQSRSETGGPPGEARIVGFAVDAATGRLTLLPPGPASSAIPVDLAVEPRGRFLFAAVTRELGSVVTGGIDAYAIQDDGSLVLLQSLQEGLFQEGLFLYTLAVDPQGRFLFAGQASRVLTYAIETNGSLSPRGNRTLASPAAAVVPSPGGDALYVPAVPGIYGFRVDSLGGLTPLADSPYAAPSGRLVLGLSIDPTGRFAVATTFQESGGLLGFLASYAIEPGTGRLTLSPDPELDAGLLPDPPLFGGRALAAYPAPAPTATIGDATVLEGAGEAWLEVSLSAPSRLPVSIPFTTVAGTAQAGTDFLATAGKVVVAAGYERGYIRVPIFADVEDEPSETFFVSLSMPDGAILGDARGGVTILDDDRAPACQVITTLPFTISTQGRYCATANLSTAITSGAAITINADFVELDLRGLKIGGGSAGTGTQAYGVYAKDRRNLTIRGGNIRGFRRGIFLEDSGSLASQGHLVTGVRLDGNTEAGIWAEGRNIVVRGNHVQDTTGSALPAVTDTFGIRVEGPAARALNNDVTNTVGVAGGQGIGVLVASPGSVAENNRVAGPGAGTASSGIAVQSGADVLVVGNRLSMLGQGVSFSVGTTGKFRGNVTSGVSTPYSGGTDAGNNQ